MLSHGGTCLIASVVSRALLTHTPVPPCEHAPHDNQTAEAEAGQREAALLREAADGAQSALREERGASTAAEARREEETERAAAETASLRQQLDSAVSVNGV